MPARRRARHFASRTGGWERLAVRGILRRYSHIVFGVLQSGLISAVAVAIALLSGGGGLGLRWGTGSAPGCSPGR